MLIAVAPLFGFWKYYATAVRSDMQVTQGRLSELRSSTAQAAATAGRIDVLRKDVARLERDIERFETAIPTRKDVASFLETVDVLAARSNLTVRRFAPQPAKEQSSYAGGFVQVAGRGEVTRTSQNCSRRLAIAHRA